MAKLNDTYEQWEADGILEERLKSIQELATKRITQKEIAAFLGISEKTLIKFEKIHPKLNQAFINGDTELKYRLTDKMYERAMGFDYEETQTIIEETNSGTKKKIVKNKKKSLPDFNAIRYLLITKFGREFNEKKEELDIMYKRLENNEEVWSFGNDDQSNSNSIEKRIKEIRGTK